MDLLYPADASRPLWLLQLRYSSPALGFHASAEASGLSCRRGNRGLAGRCRTSRLLCAS